MSNKLPFDSLPDVISELEPGEAEADRSTTFGFVDEPVEADDDAAAFGFGKIAPAFSGFGEIAPAFSGIKVDPDSGVAMVFAFFRGGAAAMQSDFFDTAGQLMRMGAASQEAFVFVEPRGTADSAPASSTEPFLDKARALCMVTH